MLTLTVEKHFIDYLKTYPDFREFEKIMLLQRGFNPDKPYVKTVEVNGNHIYQQELPPVEIVTIKGQLNL